jgi:hypothetical protein
MLCSLFIKKERFSEKRKQYLQTNVVGGRREEMSPLQDENVNCETNVGDDGLKKELRMTCRRHSPILGPLRVLRTSKRVPGTGSFPEMLALRPCDSGTANSPDRDFWGSVQNSLPRVERSALIELSVVYTCRRSSAFESYS